MKKKNLLLLLASLFCMNLAAQEEVKFYTFPDEGVYYFRTFSSNGRYILGNTNLMGVYYDRQENELVMMSNSPNGEVLPFTALGINNDATIICGASRFPEQKEGDSSPAVFNLQGNVWEVAALPVETGTGQFCNANAISGDGRFIVGNTSSEDVYIRACVWENGKLEVLPKAEKSYVDIAKSVSDDGTLIGGSIQDSMYGYPVVWDNGELINLSEDFAYMGSIDYVSHNGKYACGNRGEAGAQSGAFMPFIWNRETKEIIPVQVHEEASGGVIAGISEDGKIISGYSMYSGNVTIRKPFIIIDGEFNDLDEYMQTIGWEVPEEYEDPKYPFSFFTVCGMSHNGTALCGMADIGFRLGWIIEFEKWNLTESVEFTSDSFLSIYPNPVKDRMYIQGNCLSATVYNQAGISVLSSNSVIEYLDMSDLEKGIYYVKLVGDKETVTKKVIVK